MRVAFAGYRDLLIRCVETFLSSGHEIQCVLLPKRELSIYDTECHMFLLKKKIRIVWDIQELIEERIDILISVNYWRVIGPANLRKFKGGVYNIHHSYLLRYAGRNSCSWAIMEREKNNFTHGTTLHKIDENLDRGQIVDSRVIKFSSKTTATELFAYCEDVAVEMFEENIPRLLKGEVSSNLSVSKDQVIRYIKDQPGMNITDYLDDLDAFVRAWGYLNDRGPFIIFKGIKLFVRVE